MNDKQKHIRAAHVSKRLPLNQSPAPQANPHRPPHALRLMPHAFSLVELLVVVAIIALMATLVLPAISNIMRSNKMGATENIIRGMIATARAYAAENQKYAGIRFQKAANNRQYLVLIEKVSAADPRQYQAVPNRKPVALPIGISLLSGDVSVDTDIDDDDTDSFNLVLEGQQTFSIIFSPTGQLVIKQVEVHARDNEDEVFGGEAETLPPAPPALLSYDNEYRYDHTAGTVTAGPSPSAWCDGWETSTTSFYIYEDEALKELNPATRYTDFVNLEQTLDQIRFVLLNQYTGQAIKD